MTKKSTFQPLMQNLGYTFHSEKLLQQALTHRSASGESYERLEFLGDAILDFLVAEALYQRYPDAPEGHLSRMRASLVNADVLFQMAQEFLLGDYLKMGAGERKSGGQARPSILADAMEAIIGAMYLDGGFDACRDRLNVWMGDRFANPLLLSQNKDAKSTLQEWTQANRHPLPAYTVKQIRGEEHTQIFEVTCRIKGLSWTGEGEGLNRRAAEQMAAQSYLKQIGEKK